jgi:hypothetical protein
LWPWEGPKPFELVLTKSTQKNFNKDYWHDILIQKESYEWMFIIMGVLVIHWIFHDCHFLHAVTWHLPCI